MLAENNPAQTETPGDGEVGRKPTDPARPGADYGIAAAQAGLLRKERLPALAAVQCSARRENISFVTLPLLHDLMRHLVY